MKKLLYIFMLFSLPAQAQLLVNVQMPAGGIVQKPQLWNMALTNSGNSSITIHIQMVLSDVTTSDQVLSATTQTIILAPGSTQINASLLGMIQYNVLNPAYNIDAGPTGFLPAGDFEICYSFIKHVNDVTEEIAEQCVELLIEPLMPPQLVYPYDQTAIAEFNPQFSWLPPAPINLFNNLRYSFTLVEMNVNQSAADAIEQNIPIYSQQNITAINLLYPQNATALEVDKNYAWRITAKSNETTVAQTETWEFTIKQFQQSGGLSAGQLPFAKLKKEEEGRYVIFTGDLKFDYFNEVRDTVWRIKIFDLSTNGRKIIMLNMDSIPLKAGQNLVRYPVIDNQNFINMHMYVLEITNSRNEMWRLRFEYREPMENDQQ